MLLSSIYLEVPLNGDEVGQQWQYQVQRQQTSEYKMLVKTSRRRVYFIVYFWIRRDIQLTAVRSKLIQQDRQLLFSYNVVSVYAS